MVDRREHSLAEVHCGPSALECGKDAIALMEKISTAEAIVAQELARMQNKAGDNLSSSTTEYTKVTRPTRTQPISPFKSNDPNSKKVYEVL